MPDDDRDDDDDKNDDKKDKDDPKDDPELLDTFSETCRPCNGRGQVEVRRPDAAGVVIDTCWNCRGRKTVLTPVGVDFIEFIKRFWDDVPVRVG